MTTVFTIVETPGFPDFSSLYRRMGLTVYKISSVRKAISQLKKHKPDIVIAEFIYGYSNNYSGVHISNLDVFLVSLQKYAPNASMIILVNKPELQYIERLEPIVPFEQLTLPVAESVMQQTLQSCLP